MLYILDWSTRYQKVLTLNLTENALIQQKALLIETPSAIQPRLVQSFTHYIAACIETHPHATDCNCMHP